MTRDYPRLPIADFGAHLLRSGDLDPIYVALRGVRWDLELLDRWLLVYWVFYHAGTASWIAEGEGDEFWSRWLDAAINDRPTPYGGRFPRGHERRHMRGKKAADCYTQFFKDYRGDETGFVEYVLGGELTCREVMRRAAEHSQFGPWIGFKIADMAERVLSAPISFKHAEVFMFKDPKEAALKFWRQQTGQPEGATPRDTAQVLIAVVDALKDTFRFFPAPPTHDRPVDLQEVETILCKWKAHVNGHYPLWNDTREIRAGLELWKGHCPVAADFLRAMPEVK